MKKRSFLAGIFAILAIVLIAASDVDRMGASGGSFTRRQTWATAGGECLQEGQGSTECKRISNNAVVNIQCIAGATYPCLWCPVKDGDGGTNQMAVGATNVTVDDSLFTPATGAHAACITVEADGQSVSQVWMNARVDGKAGDRNGRCLSELSRPCDENADCVSGNCTATQSDTTDYSMQTDLYIFGSCSVACTVAITP